MLTMTEEPALDAFIESLHTHDLPFMLVLTDLAERQSSVITIRFFLHLGEMFVIPYDEYGLNVIKMVTHAGDVVFIWKY